MPWMEERRPNDALSCPCFHSRYSWSDPLNPAAEGGVGTEQGELHYQLLWDDCVEGLTVNEQYSGIHTPIVQVV